MGERVYLLHFRGSHRVIAIILLCLFATGVSLHLHGFSLPRWHALLDDSSTDEVLLGQPRIVRMDDYSAALSSIFAQCQHRPAFPVFNNNIGLGANMVVNPIKTPVWHYITVFRPHLWGYFMGKDVGLAWHWWSLMLGLFYSYFLLLLLLTGGRSLVAVSGGVLIAYSPFFQYKSGEYGEIAIFAALLFVSLIQTLFSTSRRRRVAWALLLAWTVGGLALNFYPPSQIALGYLIVFLTVGYLWQHRLELVGLRDTRQRLACLVGAAALAGLAVGVFIIQGWQILQILSRTVFPGGRFVTGGDYPLWRIFVESYFLQFLIPDQLPGTNISEYGSFFFFFPLIAAWAGYVMAKKRRLDFVLLSMLAFCFVLTIFAAVGFPAWLSAITFMSKVPPNRSMVALGVANTILLCLTVDSTQIKRFQNPVLLVIVATWGLFLVFVARVLVQNYPSLSAHTLLWPAILFTLLGYGLLQRQVAKPSLLALALVSIATTIWFNPLVHGGSRYLYTNPVARKMRSLSAHDRNARWATFGPISYIDYPRLLGLPSLTGTDPYPQFELWKYLDPEKHFLESYNRYAHLWFATATDGLTISSPFLDQVKVALPPTDPVLDDFDVRLFFVIPPEDQVFDRLPQFSKVFANGRVSIYRKRPPQS